MILGHLDPKTGKWTKGPAPSSAPRDERMVTKGSSGGGISFQFPPGWDDGSGKIRHVKDGLFKGRVIFSSAHEAREVAKRYEGMSGQQMRYDPM